MTFQSPLICLFLFTAVLLLRAPLFRSIRSWLFLFLSLVFIAMFLPQSRGFSLIMLLLWVASHYLMLQLMLVVSWKRPLFIIWLVLNLGWFVWVKEYLWITQCLFAGKSFRIPWSVLGYSFILFRQIHLGVIVRDGVVKSLRPLEYLNYNLAFWTFLAGPVQRFDDFIGQMRAMGTQALKVNEALQGMNRIVWGLLQIALAAPFFEQYAVVTTFTSHPSAGTFLLFLVSFPLYLYLNFAGYCDVMIGMAGASGFRLPENFRGPFTARNMVEFWSRWHMSLSSFFRDHLYFPMVMAASRRFNGLWSAVGATMVSFLLMGIWHGNSPRFALFGLLHGAGVGATMLYGAWLKAILSKEKLKAYNASGIIRLAAVITCQAYVLAAFLVFQYSFDDLRQVIAVFQGGVR